MNRLCEELDERVHTLLDRPSRGDWPYLWIDATYVKVRPKGRTVSVAVIVAVGVNSEGRREVLGMDIGSSEAEPFWAAFLRKLMRRGLRGVKLVISDAHKGIKPPWRSCCARPGSAAGSTSCNALAHPGTIGCRVVSALEEEQ